MGKLDGKVAAITGAGRGLGRALALEFARAGANLILLDICQDPENFPYPMATRKQLEQTARECVRLGSQVVTEATDVRQQRQIDQAIQRGLADLGQIDILVNNAALLGPAGRPAHELDEVEWMVVLDVNLNGAWRCSKAVLPQMVAQRSGCIINIGSTAGLVGFEMFANYVASKHGVIGLTKALALEYGRYNIRVNSVCPSTLQSDANLDSQGTAAVAAAIGSPLADYETSSKSYHALRTLIDPQRCCFGLRMARQ